MTHVPASEDVPALLRDRDQWLLWDADNDAPRRPAGWDTDRDRLDWSVSWNDPQDWLSFEEAREYAQRIDSVGVGYVMSSGGPVVGLDLDGCVEERGRPKDWLPSLKPFSGETYMEYSPSGEGIHVLLRDTHLPEWWTDSHVSDDEHEGVEAYEQKFFTVTGDRLEVSADAIASVDPREWLLDAYQAINGELPRYGDDADRTVDESIDLDVYDVLSSGSYPTEERHAHPFHDSGTGKNFHVDANGETWRCWRHGITGNALHLIGIEQNVIDCGEWEDGLSSDTWSDIFEAARDAGYDVPEPESDSASYHPDDPAAPQNRDDDTPPPEPETSDDADAVDWGGVIDLYQDGDTPKRVARYHAVNKLLEEYNFVTPKDTDHIHAYDPDRGVFERGGEAVIDEILSSALGSYYTRTERNEIVQFVRAQTYIDREKFDAGDYAEPLICVKNGVLNIATRELYDHDPDYYFRHCLPVRYDPDAECEKIDAFLDDITRREADKKTLYEMVGHALHNEYDPNRFLILIGEGSNGKSLFFNTVEKLIGDENVSGRSLQELAEQRFAKADLADKKANIAPDISSKKISNIGTIKNLTGDDQIQAEHKGEPSFGFHNSATLMFAANRPPALGEQATAIERRIVPIALPYEFTSDPDGEYEKEKTPRAELEAELQTEAELSGFLNAALDGLDRLLENGDVSLPESPEERLEFYEEFSDPIKQFARRCLTNEEGKRLRKDDVYDVYTRFCDTEDYTTSTKSVFFRELRRTLFTYEECRPTVDGEQVRCLNHATLTEAAEEYASPRILDRVREDEAEADATPLGDVEPDRDVTVTAELVQNYNDPPEWYDAEGWLVDATGRMRVVIRDDEPFDLEAGQCYKIEGGVVMWQSGNLVLEVVKGMSNVEPIDLGDGHTDPDGHDWPARGDTTPAEADPDAADGEDAVADGGQTDGAEGTRRVAETIASHLADSPPKSKKKIISELAMDPSVSYDGDMLKEGFKRAREDGRIVETADGWTTV